MTEAAPCIVNSANFVRLLELRSDDITEDVLFYTVKRQAELMQKHDLPGTFLLQYDAPMEGRYERFLKAIRSDQFEIGS